MAISEIQKLAQSWLGSKVPFASLTSTTKVLVLKVVEDTIKREDAKVTKFMPAIVKKVWGDAPGHNVEDEISKLYEVVKPGPKTKAVMDTPSAIAAKAAKKGKRGTGKRVVAAQKVEEAPVAETPKKVTPEEVVKKVVRKRGGKAAKVIGKTTKKVGKAAAKAASKGGKAAKAALPPVAGTLEGNLKALNAEADGYLKQLVGIHKQVKAGAITSPEAQAKAMGEVNRLGNEAARSFAASVGIPNAKTMSPPELLNALGVSPEQFQQDPGAVLKALGAKGDVALAAGAVGKPAAAVGELGAPGSAIAKAIDAQYAARAGGAEGPLTAEVAGSMEAPINPTVGIRKSMLPGAAATPQMALVKTAKAASKGGKASAAGATARAAAIPGAVEKLGGKVGGKVAEAPQKILTKFGLAIGIAMTIGFPLMKAYRQRKEMEHAAVLGKQQFEASKPSPNQLLLQIMAAREGVQMGGGGTAGGGRVQGMTEGEVRIGGGQGEM